MYTWTVPFACFQRARERERRRSKSHTYTHACTHTGIHGRKIPGRIEGGRGRGLKEKKRKVCFQ